METQTEPSHYIYPSSCTFLFAASPPLTSFPFTTYPMCHKECLEEPEDPLLREGAQFPRQTAQKGQEV